MALAYGTWEDAEAAIGTVLAELPAADPVNRPMLRHLLESLEWDLPRALDEEAAAREGFSTAVAPQSSYMTFGMPAYWSPGDAPLADGSVAPFAFGSVPCPGSEMFAVETSVEFPGVLRHGDWLSSVWRLVGLVRKRLSVGDGAFLDFEITYRNQDDAVVVVERTTVFRYEPEEAGQVGGSGSAEAGADHDY